MRETIAQLVVPKVKKQAILTLAGGTMRQKKLYWESIAVFFFGGAGMAKGSKRICESCLDRQLTRGVKVRDRAPISPVSRPKLPFQLVNIDLIGPIDPKS